MNTREAVALLRGAVPPTADAWADIGAGDGTFTKALLELLGPATRLYAVDRDPSAIATLTRWAHRDAPNVTVVRADFTQPLHLPQLESGTLDGMLLANALHFVRDPDVVLARLTTLLRPGGRVVIVEYDRRRASPWVPYPVSSAHLLEITAAAGLTSATLTATRPSLFGGTLYVAAADRLPT